MVIENVTLSFVSRRLGAATFHAGVRPRRAPSAPQSPFLKGRAHDGNRLGGKPGVTDHNPGRGISGLHLVGVKISAGRV